MKIEPQLQTSNIKTNPKSQIQNYNLFLGFGDWDLFGVLRLDVWI
jgi:hypothetical protein